MGGFFIGNLNMLPFQGGHFAFHVRNFHFDTIHINFPIRFHYTPNRPKNICPARFFLRSTLTSPNKATVGSTFFASSTLGKSNNDRLWPVNDRSMVMTAMANVLHCSCPVMTSGKLWLVMTGHWSSGLVTGYCSSLTRSADLVSRSDSLFLPSVPTFLFAHPISVSSKRIRNIFGWCIHKISQS